MLRRIWKEISDIEGKYIKDVELTPWQTLQIRGSYIFMGLVVFNSIIVAIFQTIAKISFSLMIIPMAFYGTAAVLSFLIYRGKKNLQDVTAISRVAAFLMIFSIIITRYLYALSFGWEFALFSYNISALYILSMVFVQFLYDKKLFKYLFGILIINWFIFLAVAYINDAPMGFSIVKNGKTSLEFNLLKEIYIIAVMVSISFATYMNIPIIESYEKMTAQKNDIITTQNQHLEKEVENRTKELQESESRLKKRNNRMEKDITIAKIVQDAIVHQPIPENSHYRIDFKYMPLERIGGDYFSIMQKTENKTGIFIGDVSGHGVASALFISLLSFLTEKIFIEFGEQPKEYMDALNRSLLGNMSSYYLTGIYGILEYNDKTEETSFCYANCAHTPPVVIKADSSAFTLDSTGGIIGAIEDCQYDENTINLKRGEKILLYTDGISETSIPSKNDILGFETDLICLFQKSVSTDITQTIDNIINNLNTMKEDASFSDDILLIGIDIV